MLQRKLKIITVNAQAADSTEPPNIQALLEENLKQEYAFAEKRFKTALRYSALATIGVIIALLVFSGLSIFNVRQIPAQFRLYMPFYEWRTDGIEPSEICLWTCELVKQGTRLLTNASDIGASMFMVDDQGTINGNIAGITRLCTLIAVFFSVWFSYRKLLLERYELHGHAAQYDDFRTMPRWQFWLTRTLYTLASLFGTYVVISLLWLGISEMFKFLILDWFNAAIIIVLFTGLTTLLATYIAVAVTTREVLMLALSIFVIGFGASFALSTPIGEAHREWWQFAVSSAGQDNPSAPVFTGTLLSGPLALLALWFDLDSILQKMIADGPIRYLSVQGWMWAARILYAMMVVGLILVGLIRVDPTLFRVNMIFHAGGASLAVLSAIFSGLLIRKQRFHPWYKFFAVYVLLGATIVLTLLGVIRVNPFGFGAVGDGLVSLTVIELVLFFLIGVWIYLTVDNLLGQADIKAFEGPVLMMARKEPQS